MGDERDRVPLRDGWMLWRHFVLRSTGFPFAALADAVSDDAASEERLAEFDWSESIARTMGRALDLAASEPIRMALLWQNPRIVELCVDWLRSGPDAAKHRNQRYRKSEYAVVKYLQRYYARNESVGFFGPVVWGTVESLPGRIVVEPGPTLTTRQIVYFEDWAIHVIGEALAGDPEIAAQLPPARAQGVVRMGRALTRPDGGLLPLTPAQDAVVRLVDGARTGRDIAAELGMPVEHVEDILSGLVKEGLLTRTFDVPTDMYPERSFAAALDALTPGPARDRARAVLDQIEAARAKVAQARTSAELSAAFTAFDRNFSAVTGHDATRSGDQAAFGRRPLVAQTGRNVRVALGTRLVDDLAGPLSLILTSARWLARRAGEEFENAALAVYEQLAPLFGASAVPLNALCAKLLPVPPDAPWLTELSAELARRWVAILRPDFDAPVVVRTTAELREEVNHHFAGPAPGFHAGRHHSPDLMIAADGPESIEAGDFQLVLGEVHIAMVTADQQSFVDFAPDPDLVTRCIGLELLDDQPRFVPLFGRQGPMPTSGWDYPPPNVDMPAYTYLFFGERVGERRRQAGRVVPATAIKVTNSTEGLVAEMPDGCQHPLLHVLGEYLAYTIVDRFRIMPPRQHTPRITIDRLVVMRETWRIPYGELEPLTKLGEREAYFRLREVVAGYGMPQHMYWRVRPESKPVYLDLHSPLLAAVLLRDLHRAAGRCREVIFTEMYPGPGQLWLLDIDGQRYTSELRLTIADTTRPAEKGN